MIYVLDSHPITWFLQRDPRLGAAAADAFRDRLARLVVPTIVLAELQYLHGRGRAVAGPAAVRALVDSALNCTVRPLDLMVLDRMPTGLEMHDAIIVATTLLYREGTSEPVRLVTNDRRITESGLVDVVW